MTSREKRDNMIAAAVTLLVALAILLVLFFTQMGTGRSALAAACVPEPTEQDVTYLEAELIPEPTGTEEAEDIADDAPLPPGEPDKAEEPQEERVEPGPNPKPAPVSEPVATRKKPSPVKKQENQATQSERKRVADMSGKFKPRQNGSPEGKNTPVNGKGKAVASGSLSGRGFLGCTTGEVELRTRVTVRVSVKVNAAGHVIEARAVSGPKEFYSKCEKWARTARWSAKEGAPTATGSITFTITPRKG